MRRSYANFWSQAAAGLTALAHTRASVVRWGAVMALTLIWIVGGLFYWRDRDPLEAFYKTLSAVGMWDDYFDVHDPLLQLVRYSAIAAPVVGLLFAFSGQLGRSLARIFNLGAANHVVIAGVCAPALTLALDSRMRGRDAVILIGRDFPEETALGLRRRGVIVLEGDARQFDTLRAARAHHAAHIVAFEDDDADNLQVEAVMRRLVGEVRRRRPVDVHISTQSPLLLREAREMRTLEQNRREQAEAKAKERGAPPPPPSAVDSKPFSLDELAARALIQDEAATILTLAQTLQQPRPHIVLFGFDEAAEAVAVRALSSLWSARLQAPRLTVCTMDPAYSKARFEARYPQAVSHADLWTADIAFRQFDWRTDKIDAALLHAISADRGQGSAIVVSTGLDSDNILVSLALKRTCNEGLIWPVPIFMKEMSQSEFSRQYARGDETPDELDAYLQAFGAHQVIATRAYVLEGRLDMGAAIAHQHYVAGMGTRDHASLKDLQAAARGWSEVRETYRNANRSSADSAGVKLWDAGWRPAARAERGAALAEPSVPDDMMMSLAKREHERWMADRLLGGWRPGAKRDNELRLHPSLKPWEALSDDERQRDVVQVKAAIDIGRTMHRSGFMRRDT